MSTSDPTFSKYTNKQAQKYAEERTSYSQKLYDIVIEHHVKTGGALNTLVDVGCGPGNVTRDLALSFDTVVGLDPGQEMIDVARQLAGVSSTGKKIEYEVASAEELSQAVRTKGSSTRKNGVDLVTAAMAAHWFDMPKFWTEVARILNPGGTVALWTCASLYCHPSTPNSQEVQKAFFRFERETLAPFELPPNRISRNLYDDLILPWTTGNHMLTRQFPQTEFVRIEWDRDGALSDGESFFSGSEKTTVDEVASSLETASMVTRWREAHAYPTMTRDCVHQFARDVKVKLGGEDNDNPSITVGSATVLLLFKRR